MTLRPALGYLKLTLFMKGSFNSTQVMFSLRATFGARPIHSETRMASLVWTWLSDLYVMKSRHSQ